jgi:hypothetical protein
MTLSIVQALESNDKINNKDCEQGVAGSGCGQILDPSFTSFHGGTEENCKTAVTMARLQAEI